MKTTQLPFKANLSQAAAVALLPFGEDPERTERVIRRMLHTLRSYLSFDAFIRLLPLLPLSYKYIYLENWKSGQPTPPLKTSAEFILTIRESAGKLAFYDFPSIEETESMVRNLLAGIDQKQSIKDRFLLRSLLPEPIHCFLPPLEQ